MMTASICALYYSHKEEFHSILTTHLVHFLPNTSSVYTFGFYNLIASYPMKTMS
jgi:hypothetical protein